MTLKKAGTVLLLLVLWNLILFHPVYAYLDPGSGSYIFQLLLATIVGLLFALRLFWGKIKRFFAKMFSKQDLNEHDAE